MFDKLLSIEKRAEKDPERGKKIRAGLRIVGLFVLVVVGILAKWFWEIAWKFLADPTAGLAIGPILVLAVRVILAFLIASLTFIPIYQKVGQNTSESWIPFFLAFQNGFFWQATFDAIAAAFG